MYCHYGEKNLLRMLDEGEFWKRQEEEHTIVIRQLLPDLEEKFVVKLQEYEQAFAQTEGIIIRYIELLVRANYNITPYLQQEIIRLINFSLDQSQNFIIFLNQMVNESQVIRTNQIAIVVINHIRRESEYFVGTAQAILQYYL